MDGFPVLNVNAVCPKCGHDEIGMGYRYRGCPYPAPCGARAPFDGEHMDRWCKRCHYQWAEAVLAPATRTPAAAEDDAAQQGQGGATP